MGNRSESGRIFRRGRIWYTHVYAYENGERRRVQVSTRCTDRTAAQAVDRQLQRDAADPDHAAAHRATMSRAVERLLEHRQELVDAGRRSNETISFYRTKLGHWIRLLEGDPEAGTYKPFRLAGLRQRHFDAFITARRKEGAGDVTIAKETRAMIAVLTHAKRSGLWRGDVDELMPPDFAPEYKPRSRWLPMAELQALLAQLLADRAARVAFAVATGANRSEAGNVLREDVDLERGRVLLRGTKTPNRWRTIVVALPWQRELITYALKHGEGTKGRLFRAWGSQWAELAEACDDAKIARCSSNDLRRTYAHWLRAEGVSLETIAPLMGHTTTQMVQRVYGRLDPDELAARLHAELGARCIAGASDARASDGLRGRDARKNAGQNKDTEDAQMITPGFMIPARLWPKPRKYASKVWESRAAASRVQQEKPRKRARRGS